MSDRFQDDIAVVTGGGAHTDRALGIGEETAKLLPANNRHVGFGQVARPVAY